MAGKVEFMRLVTIAVHVGHARRSAAAPEEEIQPSKKLAGLIRGLSRKQLTRKCPRMAAGTPSAPTMLGGVFAVGGGYSSTLWLGTPDASNRNLTINCRRVLVCSSRENSRIMVTCFLRYEIDTKKIAEFEYYGQLWIRLVNKMGGKHHGYLLPSEGPNDVALASFTFPSLAAYEEYRRTALSDPECQAAYAYANETNCIRRYERTFFRPLFE